MLSLPMMFSRCCFSRCYHCESSTKSLFTEKNDMVVAINHPVSKTKVILFIFRYDILIEFCSVSCHCCCCCWYLFTDEESEQKKSNLFNYLSSFPNNNQKYSQECFKKQKSKIFAKIFKSKNLWFETEFCCF